MFHIPFPYFRFVAAESASSHTLTVCIHADGLCVPVSPGDFGVMVFMSSFLGNYCILVDYERKESRRRRDVSVDASLWSRFSR